MAELDDLRTFDIAGAAVTVWTFKKSTPAGQPPVFSGHWIDVDDALAAALREAMIEVRAGIAETHPYGLLAQVNEGSALILGADETHAPAMVAQTDDPTPARKVRQLKEINNSAFYVVKLVGGGRTLHAVRRTDDTWRTKKSLTSLNVFYTNEGLTLDPRPRFTLSRYFDFLIHDDTVFVLDKNRFESVLSYKQAQIEDFTALQAEPAFVAIFADIAPLVAFVGSNKIHLRRACAIREKGNFARGAYMDRLRQEYGQMGFTFDFDDQGRFICTEATCPDIIKALLDHRLDSRLSGNLYDVENTEVVG
jgi:hypothetical protein